MTGQELFDSTLIAFTQITPSKESAELYKEIRDSLKDFQITDSFFQLRRNSKGDGLALEIMMFNKELYHDIVFTQKDLDYITIKTKGINTVYMEVNKENLKLTIEHEGNLDLVYLIEVKRFSEINKIKSSLINLIGK